MKRRQGTASRYELRQRIPTSKIRRGLPLIHITPVGIAREILHSGQLEARHCKIFDKSLLYFFVCKPAYRLANGNEKSDQISRFPFVFLSDSEHLPAPYHVFPFDTGGAATSRFDSVADPFVHLEDYELSPNLESAECFIDWAFDDLASYLNGDLKPELHTKIPVHDLTTHSFIKVAKMSSSTQNDPETYDDRASSVEVAFSEHLSLIHNVSMAIIPKQFLEIDGPEPNKTIIDRLEELKIKWALYNWQPNRPPDDFKSEIITIVKRHLKEKGLL